MKDEVSIASTWANPKPHDQVSKEAFADAVHIVEESNDPTSIVTILAPFLNKHVDFEYREIEFSPQTGKPVRYDWKPLHDKWDGTLDFSNWGGWNMPKSIGENTLLHKLLRKKRHILVPLNGDNYLLSILEGESCADGDSPDRLELFKL